MTSFHIIFVPGLNDTFYLNSQLVKFIPWFWKRYGVDVHVIKPHWNKGKYFAPKLKLITDKIDEVAKNNNKVYLVGQSAGGAAVLNAFVAKKEKVAAVVVINGRLRKGTNVFPSLDVAARNNPAFKESVLLFENTNEKKLTKEDRKRILTIHPFWDDVVPIKTATLVGAQDITMPIITHMLGGIVACTFYSKRIVDFFKRI